MTPEGTALSTHRTEVVSLVASVAVSARLIDPSTKETLWAVDFSYEGFDLPAALHAVADMMTRAMMK